MARRSKTPTTPPGPGRHVLMLLSNDYTYDGRVRQEAGALVRAGHQVTVVAWDRRGDAPSEETIDGVKVRRVATRGLMRPLLVDVARLPLWWRRAARAALRIHRTHPVDLLHCHDYDTLPAAVRVRRRIHVPLVYDAHEIWSYMVARDLPPPVPAAMERHETRLLRHVDEIITVSDPCAEHLRARTDRPVSIVMNAKRVAKDYSSPANARFRALYVGSLNPSRLILETIQAAKAVPAIDLVVAGAGRSSYVAAVEAAAQEASNVRFIGRVPETEVLPMTRAADLVVCLFAPTDLLTRIGMPNKVFEAIAAGRPVLATHGTYLGTFVTEHHIGLAVIPEPGAIAAAIRTLADDPATTEAMGRAALALGARGFDWATQEATLLAVHDAAIRHASGATPVK